MSGCWDYSGLKQDEMGACLSRLVIGTQSTGGLLSESDNRGRSFRANHIRFSDQGYLCKGISGLGEMRFLNGSRIPEQQM